MMLYWISGYDWEVYVCEGISIYIYGSLFQFGVSFRSEVLAFRRGSIGRGIGDPSFDVFFFSFSLNVLCVVCRLSLLSLLSLVVVPFFFLVCLCFVFSVYTYVCSLLAAYLR